MEPLTRDPKATASPHRPTYYGLTPYTQRKGHQFDETRGGGCCSGSERKVVFCGNQIEGAVGGWRVASGAWRVASGVATAACHPHIHHWPLLPCQHPSSFQAVSIDICTLNNFVISPAGPHILTKTTGTQFLLALLHPAPCTKVNLQPGLLETFVQETA